MDDIKDKLVLGILNFPPKQVGEIISEILALGLQYLKAKSGKATFITPARIAKIGGKVF